MISRRHFLGTSAVAMAGVALNRRVASASPMPIAATRAVRRMTPAALLPDPPSVDLFRRLALVAVETAKQSGADFADVRVGVRRSIAVGGPPDYGVFPELIVGYGVRARAAGTWGFQYGNLLTDDAVVAAARSAVAGAKRYAAANARLGRTTITELAPAPVARGEWRGPNAIDPFTVPIDDYIRVIGFFGEQMAPAYRNHTVGNSATLGWVGDTRVFASTDGSLTTQQTMLGGPIWGGHAVLPADRGDAVRIDLPGLEPVAGGFELALHPEQIDYLLTGIDDAAAVRALPIRPFPDVGRYPVVLHGRVFASVIGATASMAVDGDRVSGAEADASGGTFLTPPDEILGASMPQFSPLLTAHVDRPETSAVAARWDDEGVVPEPYTIIDRGRVVDYHTTRDTAPLLATWYRTHGRPLRAHGTAIADSASGWPAGTGGYVHVVPGAERRDVMALARDISHGFIVRDGDCVAESGLTLAYIRGAEVIEVRRGAAVARTRVSLQAVTKTLLKDKLIALGDAETVRSDLAVTSKGIPWAGVRYPVSAPAALCKDVDVVSWRMPI